MDEKIEANNVLGELERELEHCEKLIPVFERHKEKHGEEDHHSVFAPYGSHQFTGRCFLVKKYHEAGFISDEEFAWIANRVQDLASYERERLSERARVYGENRKSPEESERWRSMILHGPVAQTLRFIDELLE